jgi:uncharacterized repeat protein (TIGR03803 family)
MRLTPFTLAAILILFPHVSAQTAKVKVLHDFGSSNDGNVPSGSLFLDNHGNLYGVTGGGPGEYGYGIAFELTPQENGSWNETILHTFASADGFPWGAFVNDSAGNLYGTTDGGPISNSEVYELSPASNTWTFSVLYTDGAGPGLIMDGLGNLYGAIGPGDYFGLGAIGELSPGSSGWTYTQLYGFTCDPSCAGGYDPTAPPIWDSKGNLWGTMLYGGTQSRGWGLIFEMTPEGDGTWTYNVVHEFGSSSTDGQFPVAGLTLDAAGNFYGETEDGGTQGLGIIFKFSDTNGKVKGSIIHNFSSCSTGCYPEGTLAVDKSGNLYGMAQGGPNSCGGPSCGVVFKLAPQKNGTWKYSVVYNLDETTGGTLPYYGLIFDDKGNLYGVTSSGGHYGFGTAFEITP